MKWSFSFLFGVVLSLSCFGGAPKRLEYVQIKDATLFTSYDLSGIYRLELPQAEVSQANETLGQEHFQTSYFVRFKMISGGIYAIGLVDSDQATVDSLEFSQLLFESETGAHQPYIVIYSRDDGTLVARALGVNVCAGKLMPYDYDMRLDLDTGVIEFESMRFVPVD